MNPDGTGASFREQSTWAQMITTTLIYTGVLIGTFQDPTNARRTAGFLAGAVVLQVIALAVLHAVSALRTPPEPDDERDADIQLRSTRYSRFVLAAGVVLAIIAILTQQALGGGGDSDEILLHPMLAGQFLLFCFVGSEVVRLATQAVAYRRGA